MGSNDRRIDWDEVRRRLAGFDDDDGITSAEQRRRLLERRADRYRRRKKQQITETVDLVMFERFSHRYAVPLGDLEEIRKGEEFRPVPGVSPVIAGVINVRGDIVAIHDLATFRGNTAAVGDDIWILIGHSEGVLLGLIADHVHGVRSPSRNEIRPVPLSLDSSHGEFAGVVDETVPVLDFDGLTDNPEFFMG